MTKKSDDLAGQKDIVTQLLGNHDYLTACEVIIDTLGEQTFGELAADEFRRPGFQPSEIHNI